MKKTLLLIFSLFLFSCGINRVYTPANYGATKKYIAKPIYNGKDISAKYISLSISDGTHPYRKEEVNDKKLIGVINFHRSKTFKKFNYYYGLGIGFGTFKFKNALYEVIQENEKQNFYILNPKVGFSFKKSSSKIEYHFIGLELNYNYENGSYYNKLSEIPSSSSIRVVNPKSLISLNVFTELLYKINRDNTIGLGLFSGGIIGLDEEKYDIKGSNGGGFGGLTISYRHKKITVSIIGETGVENIESINYGITYQF